MDLPLQQAIRTTSRHLHRLKEMGIETVRDFLLYMPRAYTDSREVRHISEISIGENNVIRAKLASLSSKPSFRNRMSFLHAIFTDATGSLRAVWFNQPYLQRMLRVGEEYLLSGKIAVKKSMIAIQNPSFETVSKNALHMARIVPIYPETDLISSKWIREKLFPLMRYADEMTDFLDENIQSAYRLIPLSTAIRSAHFPRTENELAEAKRRLAFNELFLLQLACLKRKMEWRRLHSQFKKTITPNWNQMKNFAKSLPWPLTGAQKKAIYEIVQDLGKPFPMSRLLEGDVGSGKTAVAAAALYTAINHGYQTCLLAPTEILARQHFATLKQLLSPFQMNAELLVGALTAQEKKKILTRTAVGEAKLIVGTHALLQEKVTFSNLGLAIIDEQHRFGVRQRELLKTHGSPHILMLTATPIPRTLALVMYGEHNLSILDEMPPGRKPVTTRIVPEEKRRDAYAWIDKEIGKGRQAFIIFPLIDESPLLEVKAATKEWVRLSQEIFPERRVGLLHGQMKPDEKENVMMAFRSRKIDILVSTAVVEVGVDVPNATIMMIEGAERFGLAQLHQFRGRIGRGEHESFCFLFHSSISSALLDTGPTRPASRARAVRSQQGKNSFIDQRLQALVRHHSGFKLAEIDLNLRGPGTIYGLRQSGIPDLRMANLGDSKTVTESRQAAENILAEDPQLEKHPELQKKITEQENIAVDY